MKALILAAGEGSRLQPRSAIHKCLITVHGRRVIDYILMACETASISEVVIVTGANCSDLPSAIEGSGYKLSIKYQIIDDWYKGNGVSAYAARRLIQEPFILLMSDHIFDPQTLTDVQVVDIGDQECVVAIDYKLDSVHDEADTTKVLVDRKSGRVLSIGKKLSDFNAYDTGMFKCSPSLFSTLASEISQQHFELTDTMNVLATHNRLRAQCISGKTWFDVDTTFDINQVELHLSGQVENLGT